MKLENLLADVGTLPTVDSGAGAGDGALRLPITGRDGSASTAYHLRLPPGASTRRHVNRECDELAIHLSGAGVVGHGANRADVRAGHCRLVPRGTEQFFVNESDEEALLVGYLAGAGSLEAAGREDLGAVTDDDRGGPRGKIAAGVLIHLDDVPPANMKAADGWSITDFRMPLGAHNGSASTLFRARFFPGAIHKKHRHENCEELYYVISGRGLAGAGRDRVEVHGGHFHYIPSGVEHWLHNLSGTEPIEVVGTYIDAGGVPETGYVYMGEVTEEDLVSPGV